MHDGAVPARCSEARSKRSWKARKRSGDALAREGQVYDMMRHRLSILLAVGFVASVTFGAILLCAGVSGASPASTYTTRERFGVGLVTSCVGQPGSPNEVADYAGAEDLGFGWYADWRMRLDPPSLRDIEYVQTLDTEPWKSASPDESYLQNVRSVTEHNPGALWIVGNEPDHPDQGNCTPAEYADVYHRAFHFLKAIDPTARVAIGGLVMPSPLRLVWLEQCLTEYQNRYGTAMPVEVWNIHMQLLRENWWDTRAPAYHGRCCYTGTWGCGCPVGLNPFDDAVRAAALSDLTSCDNADPVLFQQLIWSFREWLVEHDQGDKPLIISEYGVLMPDLLLTNGADDVLRFMNVTFTFMLTASDPVLGYSDDGDRLVQRWLWYSLNGPLPEWVLIGENWCWSGFNGSLYDCQHPDRLTPFGDFFRDYVAGRTIDRPHEMVLTLIRR